ncbi:MAG: PilZ domain-containing protein [Leptospirales bacterium]|nr:PilZ domain-containing protein [Leptospirales bacterium]
MPRSLLISGLILLLLPLFNYLAVSYHLLIPPQYPIKILSRLNLIELALMVLAIPVGIGLLRVKRWGWYSFLVFGVLLILYNIYALSTAVSRYNLVALLETCAAIAAIFVFVRRDIAAPYLRMYPRGWRFQRRVPVEFPVRVEGQSVVMRDASDRGVYVAWDAGRLSPGASLKLQFDLGGESFALDAGLVRIDADGCGIAFRNLSRSDARRLRSALQGASAAA